MSRYIDADALLESVKSKRLIFEESTPIEEAIAEQMSVVIEEIEETPNADVVEVVRCKDCKHYGGVTYGFVCRKYSGAETKVCTEKDHYCSYGERREE